MSKVEQLLQAPLPAAAEAQQRGGGSGRGDGARSYLRRQLLGEEESKGLGFTTGSRAAAALGERDVYDEEEDEGEDVYDDEADDIDGSVFYDAAKNGEPTDDEEEEEDEDQRASKGGHRRGGNGQGGAGPVQWQQGRRQQMDARASDLAEAEALAAGEERPGGAAAVAAVAEAGAADGMASQSAGGRMGKGSWRSAQADIATDAARQLTRMLSSSRSAAELERCLSANAADVNCTHLAALGHQVVDIYQTKMRDPSFRDQADAHAVFRANARQLLDNALRQLLDLLQRNRGSGASGASTAAGGSGSGSSSSSRSGAASQLGLKGKGAADALSQLPPDVFPLAEGERHGTGLYVHVQEAAALHTPVLFRHCPPQGCILSRHRLRLSCHQYHLLCWYDLTTSSPNFENITSYSLPSDAPSLVACALLEEELECERQTALATDVSPSSFHTALATLLNSGARLGVPLRHWSAKVAKELLVDPDA